ncbi:MAG: agmatine deiminase family protein [Tannerellaceae bacterium]|nr:agmatine deiminase family protein [Tannerellaceae bacterium]
MDTNSIIWPAEWQPQSGVQLTWPHEETDWARDLDQVIPCFVAIAREIVKREKLLIVCRNEADVRQQLGEDVDMDEVIFRQIPSNDTWARDHGGIGVYRDGVPLLHDFVFNGWGMKYAANLDNRITQRLFFTKAFDPRVKIEFHPLVLEGGSIESDGQGTLLTTAACLLSFNRNDRTPCAQIEAYLLKAFGLRRVLRLENGSLEGDDTDAHVDTLARFCSPDTIAYVQCSDPADEHYSRLQKMEKELQAFRQENGMPYRLLPLPMAEKVIHEGKRLPATYANFLVINGAVLVPFYHSPEDDRAANVLQTAFPDRQIIGIDSRALILQHGSLHCVTMQYPLDFL